MLVYFIGIHYKEGFEALDSRTKSGQTIDKIISGLPQFSCVKSNLICDTKLPPKSDTFDHAQFWKDRFQLDSDDVVVLLGKFVRENFGSCGCRVVHLNHPASVYGSKAPYVSDAILRIMEAASNS